jgi:ubiquinone/menaquinone biosynthesis C-methylase UbiE
MELNLVSNLAQEFNKIYTSHALYYGPNPSEELVVLVRSGIVPKGLALDLGAGEGRDSIFLAEEGFDVIAVDFAESGLTKLKKFALERDLSVETIVCNALDLVLSKNSFTLVVATTFLDHLDRSDQILMIQKIKEWLKAGGFIFAEVFTVDDPGFRGLPIRMSECAKFVRTYYERGELLKQFSDFELQYYAEKIEYDESHGLPHYHGTATLIAKKPSCRPSSRLVIKSLVL